MLGIRFRFGRLENAGRWSETARSESWLHKPSGTRLLPVFESSGRIVEDGLTRTSYRCRISEHDKTHEPVFVRETTDFADSGTADGYQEATPSEGEAQGRVAVSAKSSSRVLRLFMEQLGLSAPGN